MTSVLLPVSCVNDCVWDVPQSFFVTLDDAVIARIRTLSAEAARLGVYSMSEFFFEGNWSEQLVEDVENADDLTAKMSGNGCLVDVPMLTVCQRSFSFKSVPRHAGDDMALRTPQVDLTVLDDTQLYVG